MPTPTEARSRRWPPWLTVALAVCIIGCVYLHRLDRPLLWADEAQTGIAARNVLRTGIPTAFDGRNAAVIDSGRTLDRSLTFKQIPWACFYVGAASLALFGDDTAGLRTLFALLGALAFIPLHAALRRRVPLPWLVAALVLLAPQTVLFQRSARYYPLIICLFSVLLWHVSADFATRRLRLSLGLVLFVLLFHTQVAVALGCSVSVLLFCALWRRALLWEYALAVGAGLLSWFAWYQSLQPSLGVAGTQLALLPSRAGEWLAMFLASLSGTLLDFDAVGAFPVLLWAGLLAWVLSRRRGALAAFGRDPLVAFLAVSVVVQVFASAAVFGSETVFHYSLLRYHAHLVVALMLLGLLALKAAIVRPAVAVLLCAAWFGCNLLSVSYWCRPEGRVIPASWVPPVCAELAQPHAEAWDQAIEALRAGPDTVATREQVILAMPPWIQEVTLFYLGDRYLVPPLFTPDVPDAEGSFRRAVGEDAYAHLTAQPAWILDSLGIYGSAPAGYDVAALIPSRRARPDDGTRPELTRHAFEERQNVSSVKLFRRRD